MSFILRATYYSPKFLHLMHHTVKTKDFIIGSSEESSLHNARKQQYEYVAEFFNVINDKEDTDTCIQCPDLREIPMEPIRQSEFRKQLEFFCTADPCSWKINVWLKKTHKGFIYNSYSKELLFTIDVMEIPDIYE